MITLLELIGGRIVDYEVVEDTPIGNVPAFVIQKANRYYQVEVLMDPEGNGPGHLDVADITDEVSG